VKPSPFPWERFIGFGLGVLRLSPESFWRMTPREFAAAMRVLSPPAAASIDRRAFEALRARFPDAAHENEWSDHG
jgi:uncharacterized phage protein (TIGR02216 family)